MAILDFAVNVTVTVFCDAVVVVVVVVASTYDCLHVLLSVRRVFLVQWNHCCGKRHAFQ